MGFKLFLLFEKFLMILPKNARKDFFIFLAKIAYFISARYRKVGFINLDFIFGDTLTQKEKEEIVRYSFKNLLLNFLHLMEIRHMSKDELAKKVSVKNIESVQRAHEQQKAVIYVTSHYCAWELGGTAIGAFAEPIAAVYKKMKNIQYQNWVLESRSHFKNSSLEKSNVIKPLIRLIKDGKASGILIDTGINQREGVEVQFLGKNVRQTSTPAYLARKYNAAIIPVIIQTDDEENYTLTFFDEIPVENSDNEQEDIQKATQLQADWLSKIIKENPKFWFWIHRRFKSDYKEIYKKRV
ncbi:MAG: lipid A biosynthesis lauroyl acyltransferase [Sulfurimonas sp.]|jgi:KDO2-lipid IV(A) lauroyltransferase|uniref:lipid A biosynthesis lauroyl acyltransferase n=1 Tax=unclassified Sulfurimonas TaxID=2623549 RepID=UPI0008AD815A|nr:MULTISPECIES: lipid A biosynthesis lauroyl acyltransferase [unclassified Sulfurimonas]OHE15908.1 MAG: lipid A biosynthesis acyltransferase [Sulfurimonas sp. RIFOXYB2_FULL_37_5]MBS4068341.1 lipid A biosynthesis acyltransferase [Sulfurimonas sp.]MDD3855159.1 lipid A biosynthesis lauroyl acyltransferase [Sulfurimonas sp.]MDX9755886.1 lipid A biosynthesis lauroyl acyltransferase [Sulfurimonas sp.]OHE04842.1 MAG: lipid A biosynthesis acyltransferase [Sulfurimonas sp. RIFOXYB12_FULL_35_9]